MTTTTFQPGTLGAAGFSFTDVDVPPTDSRALCHNCRNKSPKLAHVALVFNGESQWWCADCLVKNIKELPVVPWDKKPEAVSEPATPVELPLWCVKYYFAANTKLFKTWIRATDAEAAKEAFYKQVFSRDGLPAYVNSVSEESEVAELSDWSISFYTDNNGVKEFYKDWVRATDETTAQEALIKTNHSGKQWNMTSVIKEPRPPSEEEAVDHPDHYKAGGIEVIDIIEAYELSFSLGSVIKYILRKKKARGDRAKRIEDLKKATWYLAREIAMLEAGK